MTERETHPEPPKPSLRWHNAIRKLPGNMETEDKFITYPEVTGDGVVYSFQSLTAFDPVSTLPEGIYINTSINLDGNPYYHALISPILKIAKDLITQEPGGDEMQDVAPDVDEEMSRLGAKINLGNTVGLRIAALTKSKMIVFAIQPVDISDLKGSTRLTP